MPMERQSRDDVFPTWGKAKAEDIINQISGLCSIYRRIPVLFCLKWIANQKTWPEGPEVYKILNASLYHCVELDWTKPYNNKSKGRKFLSIFSYSFILVWTTSHSWHQWRHDSNGQYCFLYWGLWLGSAAQWWLWERGLKRAREERISILQRWCFIDIIILVIWG